MNQKIKDFIEVYQKQTKSKPEFNYCYQWIWEYKK